MKRECNIQELGLWFLQQLGIKCANAEACSGSRHRHGADRTISVHVDSNVYQDLGGGGIVGVVEVALAAC